MVEDIYTLLFNIKAAGGPQFAGQTKNATTNVNGLTTAQSGLNKTTKTTTTTVNKAATGINKTGKAASSAAGSIKSFGSGITTMALGISTAVAGAVGLMRSYRDLNDAQLGVDRAQRKVSLSTEALGKAQTKLKEVAKKNGKHSKEYAAAQLDVKQAQDAVGIATFNLGEKQETLGDIQQNFYMNLLPVGLGILTATAGAFEGFGSKAGEAAKGVGKVSRASKLLSGGLKLLPFALIAGALFAIRTNAFGFRDALDKLGAKVGAMFPQLKGFLTWVRELGAALGLTGGKLDLSKAWKLLTDGFNSFKKVIETTDWSKVMDSIGTQIESAINNFDWATAWLAFKNAMFSAGEWIAPRIALIAGRIAEAIQTYDWAGAWAEFQNSMYALGTWIAPKLQLIGQKILEAIQAYDWQGAWSSFRAALFATGVWVGQQLALIGGLILTAIQNYDWVGAWATFRAALFATGVWVGQQLVLIGGEILKAIQAYDWVGAWAAFRAALWATGKWAGQTLVLIGGAILKAIQNYDWVGAWAAFRAAMYAGGKWVGQTLLLIVGLIGKWWNSNKGELTKAFFGFFNFIYSSALTAGKKIPSIIMDGLKKAADTLVSAGKYIWGKIADGLGFAGKTLAQIGSAIANKLQGKAHGGIIQSAARGKVFTTHGPTLTLAGDNVGGKESVAYIPHNDPWPTLNALADIFGPIGTSGLQVRGGGGGGGFGGKIPAVIMITIGGKTITQQVELALGQSVRAFIP